jgi:hypothetical protein
MVQKSPLGQSGLSLLGKFDGEFAKDSQTFAGTGTVR